MTYSPEQCLHCGTAIPDTDEATDTMVLLAPKFIAFAPGTYRGEPAEDCGFDFSARRNMNQDGAGWCNNDCFIDWVINRLEIEGAPLGMMVHRISPTETIVHPFNKRAACERCTPV